MIEVDVVVPLPVGDLVEARLHRVRDLLLELPRGGLERVLAVALDDLEHAAPGRDLRGDARAQVEPVHHRRPRVAQEERLDLVAVAAAVHELQRGDDRTFLEHVRRADHEAARDRAADVLVVHDERAPGDDVVAREDRRHHDEVVEVDRPDPRVVRDEHVAVADVGEPLEDRLHRHVERRRVEEDVDAGEEAVAVPVEQPGVEVERLVDELAPGLAGGGHRLLVVDRPQPVADHLVGDRVEPPVGHLRAAGVIRARPGSRRGSSRARRPPP